ncbi:hypothetical protein [Ligilactobacillus agilis]|uniref:hypothetical protein n=1 Tax=Ligilactobacillus agilis TaxID=1601 RepID=UPI001F19CFCF|nr:hypothetical protein [Ligilactobacillus agilis]
MSRKLSNCLGDFCNLRCFKSRYVGIEEINKTKKYRIESVYYEFSVLKIVDEYTHEQYEKIVALNSKWSDYDFDKIDGYIYFVDLEKELVPPELTPADRKRFIEYLKKEIEVVNK